MNMIMIMIIRIVIRACCHEAFYLKKLPLDNCSNGDYDGDDELLGQALHL